MTKKRRIIAGIVFGGLMAVFLIAALLVGSPAGEEEPIGEAMRDAVLHETRRVDLLGLAVNPGLIAAFSVTGLVTLIAVLLRVFLVPRFVPVGEVPGKAQLMLETAVDFFSGLARGNSPHRHRFLGAYAFTAGVYVAVGTLFELLGLQAVTVAGTPVTLPAPLSDINGAIAMGVASYGVILVGGLVAVGPKGAGRALKDFSLPLSMSFRLFGALLSGALVTELVYAYPALRFGVPVLVGVMFTVLHAIIQTYVLVMLTTTFYGESTQPVDKTRKNRNRKEEIV